MMGFRVTNTAYFLVLSMASFFSRAAMKKYVMTPITLNSSGDAVRKLILESYFAYLFGVIEPRFYDAIDVATGMSILFAPRLSPDYAVWLGKIKPLDFFKEKYLVDAVFYTDEIARVLDTHYQGPGQTLLFLLHGLNADSINYSRPADLEVITIRDPEKTLLFLLHGLKTGSIGDSPDTSKALRMLLKGAKVNRLGA